VCTRVYAWAKAATTDCQYGFRAREVIRLAASTTPQGPTGVIAGQVLQLARRSAKLSQEALAEQLDVSLDTLQGWESGRRRLPATRIEALVDVRHELAAAGADHQVVAALEPALDADWLIGRTLEARGRAHPLAVLVTTRQVHDLLVWALTGHRPSWLPSDGTGNSRPGLGAPERRAMFARLRELAEGADSRQGKGAQLRRQAIFLAAYDPAPDTDAWLASLPAANPRPGEWSPEWVAARSRAVTEAARGNPERLRWFIDRRIAGDERLELAQLAWNAHYYGELGSRQTSEAFMVGDLPAWRGDRLLGWLAGRLDPSCGYVDLIAHELWALLASRHYLATDTDAAGLRNRVGVLAGAEVLSERSRRELSEVAYLLRALNPKGDR
jgi:DNA-binding transcriptional regulator YiaG